MKTKRGSFLVRRELWGSGLALALLVGAEAWMVWQVGRDCSPAVSTCESTPGVGVANEFMVFN